MQLREMFARGEADATVWNLDEVRDHLGPGVRALPLGDEIARDLALRNSRAALIRRSDASPALEAVCGALETATVTGVQAEVLRGERIPQY
jgi:hypothetical protein